MAQISIFVGSVYGNAQQAAELAQEKLEGLGHSASLFDDPAVSDFTDAQIVLFITSTTGQGDLPPNIEFFVSDLRDQFPLMEGKPFAVVALGDSSYGDTFAGAGKQVFELLTELQGKAVTEVKIVDAMETFEPESEVLPWLEDTFLKNL